MKLSPSKYLFAAVIGAMMALGGTQAAAAPVFKINPSVIGGPAGLVTANALGGSSSERISTNLADGTHAVTTGWLSYSSFRNNSANVAANKTGLGFNYGLYVVFSLSDAYNAGTGNGTINSANSTNTLTALTFQMFADPGNMNDYIAADATADGDAPSEARVIDNGAADILLGTGGLVSGISGFNNLGGVYLNANTAFELTAAGSSFFVEPNPFFFLSFNGFNNASGGVTTDDGLSLAVNDGSGTTTFSHVPEPGTLTLLGLGLLGLGVGARRKA
ncbi:flocculation-associated PEP-CTERM protein PepA [Massilia cavernae]|uniref:Flocculation-associated PEP-CTERM protein PepA n=1 Tax=Massilia cavernae TaxID=2320864 RepID=A0A418Y648_9BURK|nr:flocculation-associated PEP-CTERM protein PepA [Massilia cavernae]RJG23248.1 flocculation-associated PEP-CTERM protein PepA [Massilia cavernae]